MFCSINVTLECPPKNQTIVQQGACRALSTSAAHNEGQISCSQVMRSLQVSRLLIDV